MAVTDYSKTTYNPQSFTAYSATVDYNLTAVDL